MRRRVAVQKEAAGAAPQTHRLTDIEVKEVSVVDRAANRRKFLVVKREQPVKEPEPMKISPKAKAELQEKIKGILEAADAVSKSLETAETAEGAPTPEELTAALSTMSKLIGLGETAKAKPPKKEEAKEESEDDEETVDEGDEGDEDADDEESDDEEEAAKKKKTATKDVAKAGKKMARGRKERLAAAVSALKDLLTEVDDAPAAPAKKEPATKSADDAVTQTLRELTEHVAMISKAVSTQKARLDQIAKSTGGSRQVSTEKSEAEPESDVSWPMDMNRPITRANTPVEKSFF